MDDARVQDAVLETNASIMMVRICEIRIRAWLSAVPLKAPKRTRFSAWAFRMRYLNHASIARPQIGQS
jgi:hypothetical protein